MLRRLLFLLAWLACAVASAQTPPQNIVRMNGGYVPAYYCNYALGSFCGGESYSTTSLRTIVDATGAVTYAPNNLLVNSNGFGGTGWVLSALGAGVTPILTTAYAAGPDGIAGSASRLQMSLGGGTTTGDRSFLFQGYPAQAGSNYLGSVYVRSTDGISSYQISLVENAGTTPSRVSVAVGPTWTQVYGMFSNATTSGGQFNIALVGAQTPTNSNTADILIWHATTSAVTHETTPRPADQVVTTSAAYYGPAFDYTFGSSPTPLGLRIWQATENYALYSSDLTQSAWTLGATMTAAKTATGIGGVANSATLLTAGLTSATDTAVQAITLGSASDTYEVWIKGVTLTGAVNLSLDNGTANYVAATSSNCSLNGVATAPNTSGWVKCVLGPTTLTNPSIRIQIVNSGDAIDVDSAQLENVGVAGPPIFTAASAVATAADVPLAQNALSRCLASSSGSLVIKTQDGQASRAGTLMSANGSIMLGETSGNAATTAVGTNLTSSNTATWTSPNDVGLSWGALGLIDLSGTKTTDANKRSPAAPFYVGSTGGSSAFYDGHIRSVACYNKFVSNPQ